MKVIVTKPAFYEGSRVRPGAELDVPDDLKGSWFAKVDTPEAKTVKAAKPAKVEPKALSQLNKGGDKTFIESTRDLA